MPALIGALATPYIIKSYKLASVPCLVAALLTLVLGYALVVKYQSFLMPIFLLIAVAWSYVLYKAEKKKESKNNSSIGGTL